MENRFNLLEGLYPKVNEVEKEIMTLKKSCSSVEEYVKSKKSKADSVENEYEIESPLEGIKKIYTL